MNIPAIDPALSYQTRWLVVQKLLISYKRMSIPSRNLQLDCQIKGRMTELGFPSLHWIIYGPRSCVRSSDRVEGHLLRLSVLSDGSWDILKNNVVSCLAISKLRCRPPNLEVFFPIRYPCFSNIGRRTVLAHVRILVCWRVRTIPTCSPMMTLLTLVPFPQGWATALSSVGETIRSC
jgi:hypothetical protein